ncbi:hypothetical protein EV714DRAFT_277991 [Schizophyllum commune]
MAERILLPSMPFLERLLFCLFERLLLRLFERLLLRLFERLLLRLFERLLPFSPASPPLTYIISPQPRIPDARHLRPRSTLAPLLVRIAPLPHTSPPPRWRALPPLLRARSPPLLEPASSPPRERLPQPQSAKGAHA